jgi:hypothetical protein
MCKRKILGLSVNSINVCGMRYMSGHEETAYEEAESVFNAVKVFFEAMNGSEYKSVQRMVVHLRECMDLLYWKNGETWKADKGWSTYTKEYMETVTGILNECYAEYEEENSCDLDFYLYAAFVAVLDKCRRWMRKLIEEDPEWEVVAGMELGPIRIVTKGEYEGRGRVRAEVSGYGPERGSGVEKEREMREMREMIEALRNEVSELRNRIKMLESVKVEKSWFGGWGRQGTNVGSYNNVHEVDTKTLLCRLSAMKFDVV